MLSPLGTRIGYGLMASRVCLSAADSVIALLGTICASHWPFRVYPQSVSLPSPGQFPRGSPPAPCAGCAGWSSLSWSPEP
jgi:hypothetical protein